MADRWVVQSEFHWAAQTVVYLVLLKVVVSVAKMAAL